MGWMFRGTLLLVVGLMAVAAFGLAWLSREQRSAVFVFGGVGCVCVILVGIAFFSRAGWLNWALVAVAILGILFGAWGVMMTRALTRGVNSMVVREFEVGQRIRLDGGAPVARVGSLFLRHQKIERWGEDGYSVALTATLSKAEQPPTEMVLRKVPDHQAAEAVVGAYRVQLVDVAMNGNKSSLFTSTVVVTDTADPTNGGKDRVR